MLHAEILKTDKQLAADIATIEEHLPEDDEAADRKDNALAEAELAAKRKLQAEVNRLEIFAYVARMKDARKQKQDAGLTDGSGYKSELDIESHSDSMGQAEWAQGEQRAKLTARDRFLKTTEPSASTGKTAILTKAHLQGKTWEEAQQAEWSEQQSFHGACDSRARGMTQAQQEPRQKRRPQQGEA